MNSIHSSNNKRIICLGIESTAHTFGVSLASSEGKILIDMNAKYEAPLGKGIHPREAAQHHCRVGPKILEQVLQKSKIQSSEIDAISFSAGPGLGPVLRTGATLARAFSIMIQKPLIPVHHAIGHIEIASLMTGAQDPLVVLVSGGHTAISAFGGGYWRIFGETEDITLGNLLDTFARETALPSPGGPSVEKLAKKSHNFLELPYVVKGNDVSYSGILTMAIKLWREGYNLDDLCFSIQEISFAMLAEATERALAHTEKREVLLTGGVAANERLQQMLRIITEEHNAKFFVVPRGYSGDCGAQIAWTGILASQSNIQVNVEKSFIRPRWRLDQVKIPWR